MVSRSRRTDLFKCAGGGKSKVAWWKTSESLAKTGAHGVNWSRYGEAIGIVTVMRAGQAPSPDVIPVNVLLHGIRYTASGAVTKKPDDNCIDWLVVERYKRPSRCNSGCRLAQSGAGT